MELVDPVDIARHERCSAVFSAEIERGVSPEQILEGSKDAVLRAEERGNIQQVEDFLLIGTWAQNWIDNRNAVIEQGKQISNRMAGERSQRRAHIETSNDIRQGRKDLGIKVGPTYDELKRRRDWNARARGRDGL